MARKIGKRVPGEPRGGRGRPCRLRLHKKSKHMQRWFICNPWVRPFLVFSYAASKIQALARGFIIRKYGSLQVFIRYRKDKEARKAKLRSIRMSNHHAHVAALGFNDSRSSTQSQSSTYRTGTGKDGPYNKQLDKYLAFTEIIAQARNGQISPMSISPRERVANLQNVPGLYMNEPKWLSGGYSVWCIVRIQAWYRMCVVRRHHLQRRRIITQIAALAIQNAWRVKLDYDIARQVLSKKQRIALISPITACTRIQLAWRSYCNRRIYFYYRDLVMHKLQGLPSDVLRTIIPNESSLLDRAAGAVVRFRLGSSIFPPKVYFKIFTSRGICDVNAFAPRDYAHEKPLDAIQQHVKPEFIPKDRAKYNRHIRVGSTYFDTKVMTATSMDSWYKREERNPWRPLAASLFEDILIPPWHKQKEKLEKLPAPFHFSRLKRKTDIIRLRKQKKREWLRKAYMLAGVDTIELPPLNHTNSQLQTLQKAGVSTLNAAHEQQPRGLYPNIQNSEKINKIQNVEDMRRLMANDTMHARTYSAQHARTQGQEGQQGSAAGVKSVNVKMVQNSYQNYNTT